MRLRFNRRRSLFQQRLRLLTIEEGEEEQRHISFFSQNEDMPQKENRMRGCNSGLNADNIWREHFRISRQTFQFVGNLVRPHLLRQDTNMRRAIPVQWKSARHKNRRRVIFTI